MQDQNRSQTFKRQRKFMLIIPLLAFPFLAMIFWVLGGGKGAASEKVLEKDAPGINMSLPGAHLKDDKGLDKLSFYKEADKDSERLRERLKDDPYHKDDQLIGSNSNKSDSFLSQMAVDHFAERGEKLFGQGRVSGLSVDNEQKDPNEEKVYRKLDELNKAISSGGNPPPKAPISNSGNTASSQTANDNVSRLERMMHTIKQSDTQEDPQVSRLNSMLDKIIAVQHPEKMQDSLKGLSLKARGQVFAVTTPATQQNISFFGTATVERKLGISGDSGRSVAEPDHDFLGMDGGSELPVDQNSIEAIVPETQTLVNGSTVKLQLVNRVFVNGVEIPEGTFVYGTTSLNNERLTISVRSIGYKNSIYPVSLEVYDKSGMAGIYIPGAISRDVGKQSTDQAINGFSLTSLDPSLAAQATSAGIQAAKSLLSKKVKLVRVTVKGNYAILLRDNQNK